MLDLYRTVRDTTERLCAPLAVEDYVVQAMPDVSPAKWHLAHTTWFFETFVLEAHLPGYASAGARRTAYLFNSYYNAVGPQFPRLERGHLSRPTVAEVYAYRAHVDEAMADAPRAGGAEPRAGRDGAHRAGPPPRAAAPGADPHRHQVQPRGQSAPPRPITRVDAAPRHRRTRPARLASTSPAAWRRSATTAPGFAFDNERPRHDVYLRPFRAGLRLVTNGEYLEFIEAGGYQRPELWLSEGWRHGPGAGWQAPLYWERRDGGWWTLDARAGPLPLDPHAPVATSATSRPTPTRAGAARACRPSRSGSTPPPARRSTATSRRPGVFQPLPAPADGDALAQLFGDVWEWTQSAYVAVPGLPAAGGRARRVQRQVHGQPDGAARRLLRHAAQRTSGPATATSSRPDARWQFSGIRLAEDA